MDYGHARSRRRRRRRQKILLFAGALLTVVAVGLTLTLLLRQPEAPDRDTSLPATGTTTVESSSDTTTAADTTNTTAAETEPSVSESTSPSEPTAPTETRVPDDFFNDAAFIGDSRTEGLMLYTNLGNATFYTAKGLTVEQFFSKEVVKRGDDSAMTISDALGEASFRKVYIMLGLNELGWSYESVFVEKYAQLIDRVRELQPEAIIYIQSVLPVSRQKSDSHEYLTNSKIDHYNALLQQLAEEKGARYLAVNESVGLDGGALPSDATSDGIHLNKTYCLKWLDYLKTHT
ncbi:MAG: hypothetical protein HFJ80_00105 [Clostridiales bacterium]|nr:hypothetical protein [Clostridiales bacterium]